MGFRRLPPAIKVVTEQDAVKVLRTLERCMLVAFDTETTGLIRCRDRAVLLSLSEGINRWCVWPQAIKYFAELLQNPERRLIGHNVNFDQWMLLNVGIDIDRYTARNRARCIDTMVMHALIDDASPHDLKFLARLFLDIDMVPFKQIYGSQMRTRPLEDIFLDPINEAITVNYSALDAFATYELFTTLQRLLQGELITEPGSPYKNLWQYYMETETMFTKVLWHMEREGIDLNVKTLIDKAPVSEARLVELNHWFCQKLKRWDVNVNSGPQLEELFFTELKAIPMGYTETGKPQVSAVFLKDRARKGCEYATNLLEYRHISKRLSTNIIGALETIGGDGRIHTTYKQTGARSGRLASNSINLQNVPPDMRDAFEAGDGYILVSRDESQLEMRLTAHASGDATLCDAIKTGKDVHSATAAAMYHVAYEDVMAARAKEDSIAAVKEQNAAFKLAGQPELEIPTLSSAEKLLLKQRKGAKTINFGILYGMGPGKLSRELGVEVSEAKEIIAAYFAALPGIPEYFAFKTEEAYKTGYTTTVLGRRRQVRGINSLLGSEQAQAIRQVKNSPIQGFASEILKLAMNATFGDPYIYSTGTRLLLQIHDELIFRVPAASIKDAQLFARMEYYMTKTSGLTLRIPLNVSGREGKTWADCK